MLDLLRPFSFLSIKHPSHVPLWVNWLLPAIVAVVTIYGLSMLGNQVNVFGQQGLLDRALALVQTLAGFYIAALAAVSSFNSPHLDRTMPAPAPTMYIRYNDEMQKVEATRRRFLTAMFAYLTALSLLLSFALIAALVLAPPLREMWTAVAGHLHWVVAGMFLFFIVQMISVTFWGLFYLGERMLTPD
jgi:hypothetical protein